MRTRIRRAVLGSARKWRNIADGTGLDEGPNNCPLCRIFFDSGCESLGAYGVREYCPLSEFGENCLNARSAYDRWDKTRSYRRLARYARTERDSLLALDVYSALLGVLASEDVYGDLREDHYK